MQTERERETCWDVARCHVDLPTLALKGLASMDGVAADRRTKEEFGRVKLITNQPRYQASIGAPCRNIAPARRQSHAPNAYRLAGVYVACILHGEKPGAADIRHRQGAASSMRLPLGPGRNEIGPAGVGVRTTKSAGAGDSLLHPQFVV